MSSLPTIGFIGFGAMASRMGVNLKNKGYTLFAYTPSGKGGNNDVPFLPTPSALAEKVEIVIVCVPNDAALSQSMYGAEGALEHMRAGSLLINTSTVSPEASELLYKEGKKRNIAVIDAPVSGSTPEADAAQLIILAGGETTDCERAQPIFDAIGRITLYAGPAGCGSRLKLVVNGIMGATLAVVAEGLALGEASGLERDALFHALSELAVISPHHKRKLNNAKNHDFNATFPSDLMLKDMGLLMTEAMTHHLPLPTMAAATQQLSESTGVAPKKDYSILLEVMENQALKTEKTH